MCSILLVNKKSLFRDVFATELAKRFPDVQIIIAENCVQALEIIRMEPMPSVVIANVCLPDLTGFWLTGEIKSKYSSISCVLLSLFNFKEYIEMAVACKVDYFCCPAVANMNTLSQFIESKLLTAPFQSSRITPAI